APKTAVPRSRRRAPIFQNADVSAGFLPKHRVIGLGECLGDAQVAAGPRPADRDAHRGTRDERGPVLLADGDGDPVRDLPRVAQVTPGEYDHELVAAIPRHEVALAHHPGEDTGHSLEHRVTGQVPVYRIDRFKSVEIADPEDGGLAGPDQAAYVILQVAPVRQ